MTGQNTEIVLSQQKHSIKSVQNRYPESQQLKLQKTLHLDPYPTGEAHSNPLAGGEGLTAFGPRFLVLQITMDASKISRSVTVCYQ